MNAAHLHLMLNHLPVVGTAFCLLLLGWARWRKSDELGRVSLGAFVIVTLLAMPAYFTGEPAEELVEHLPGVTHAVIERHEQAAQVAVTAQTVLGALALTGLLAFRRATTIPGWFTTLMLAVAVIVAALMARTANLGGQVRHTEIRSSDQPVEHRE